MLGEDLVALDCEMAQVSEQFVGLSRYVPIFCVQPPGVYYKNTFSRHASGYLGQGRDGRGVSPHLVSGLGQVRDRGGISFLFVRQHSQYPLCC